MDKNKKVKIILGTTAGEKIIAPKSATYFSQIERDYIIQKYLYSGCNKKKIGKKYTRQKVGHGGLMRWMRALG